MLFLSSLMKHFLAETVLELLFETQPAYVSNMFLNFCLISPPYFL